MSKLISVYKWIDDYEFHINISYPVTGKTIDIRGDRYLRNKLVIEVKVSEKHRRDIDVTRITVYSFYGDRCREVIELYEKYFDVIGLPVLGDRYDGVLLDIDLKVVEDEGM